LLRDKSNMESGHLVANDRILFHEENARPLPEDYHKRREADVVAKCRELHRRIYYPLRADLPHLTDSKVENRRGFGPGKGLVCLMMTDSFFGLADRLRFAHRGLLVQVKLPPRQTLCVQKISSIRTGIGVCLHM
jgi:hypothetical protein